MSASSSAVSGAATANSSFTGSAESDAGTVRFDYGIMVLMVALSMGGLVLVISS